MGVLDFWSSIFSLPWGVVEPSVLLTGNADTEQKGRQAVKFQDWTIGQKVKVGFMTGLEVVGVAKREGRTVYTLRNSKGVSYEFNPYTGIQKL